MVVRQQDAARIEIERSPHCPAKRYHASSTSGTDIQILGDEESLFGEVEDQDTLFSSRAEPADKIVVERASGTVDRISDEGLASRQLGEAPRRDDGGSDGAGPFSEVGESLC